MADPITTIKRAQQELADAPYDVKTRFAQLGRAADSYEDALELAQAALDVVWFDNPSKAPESWMPAYGSSTETINALEAALSAYLSTLRGSR